jgi:glucosamine kinase
MYFIGVDGGGTKTDSVVVDLDGKIFARGVSGSSNPRNIGIEKAIENITQSIKGAVSPLKEKKIEMVFIGMPAFAEEFKEKEKEIKDLLLKNLKKIIYLKNSVLISSDQVIAFSAGTDKEEGVVIISGTGSVVRGWNKGKDIKTSGWGYLADGGGSFQIGQRAYQKTMEALDGRKGYTILTKMMLEKFKVKGINDLNKLIYCKNPVEVLAPISVLVNEAAEKGDEGAKNILIDASDYLVAAAENTIGRLDFEEEFPVVLAGGTFKSDIFLNNLRTKIRILFPKSEIIIPQKTPAVGAAKLAIKEYNKKNE